MKSLKEKLLKINFKIYFFYLLIYSLSHIWIFSISNSVYWDDWLLLNINPEIILDKFNMSGAPWLGPLHNFLISRGIWIYRLITFISFFFSGILLERILERIRFFQNQIRFFIVCFS